MANTIDLSSELTTEFFKNKKFKKGSVLIFQNKEGNNTELKITRLNRKKQICLAEPIKLYTEDEINAMDRKDAEEIITNG